MPLVSLFLTAIILANLVIANFGQWALPITALLLIPIDLVVRDVLHERWHCSKLEVKMCLLIITGSLLTTLMNRHTINIAVASCIAFFCASTVNYITYTALYKKARLIKMNVSNGLAAVVDSLVFPAIAFSVLDPLLSATQAFAKIFGGLVIAYLYNKHKEKLAT